MKMVSEVLGVARSNLHVRARRRSELDAMVGGNAARAMTPNW